MRRLAFAPLLLAAAACGADAPAGLRPTGTLTAPATTAPAATAPASTPASTPTGTPPPTQATTRPVASRPPASTPPAPPTTRPAAYDVDGDGRRDTVRIVERANSLATGRWDLSVTLSKGGTVTGVVSAEPQVRPAVLGVADGDLDGDGEVFVRVGGGASTTTYTPYTLVEDGMAEVRTPDGKALRLVVGGSVTHGDGFSCADVDKAAGRELVVLSVVSNEGTTFEGTRTTYGWNDDRVTRLGTKRFTGEQGDPAVEKSYEIDCDRL